MDFIVDIALWGQHPESSSRIRSDWESYLADYRAENSWLETLLVKLRASATHIGWRASSGEMPTTVPTLLAMVAIAVCSTIFPFVDSSGSTAADFHIAAAATAFMLALARKPWEIEHSKFLSAAMILGGTGGAHLALRFHSPGPEAAENLIIIGHLVVAAGLTGAGISGLRTKTAFGARRIYMKLFAAGLTIIVCANIVFACSVVDQLVVCGMIFLLILAEVGLILHIPRLVELSERTSQAKQAKQLSSTS